MAKCLPEEVPRVFQNLFDIRNGIIEGMKLELQLNVGHPEIFGKYRAAARVQHLRQGAAIRAEILRDDLVRWPTRRQLHAASQLKTAPGVIVCLMQYLDTCHRIPDMQTLNSLLRGAICPIWLHLPFNWTREKKAVKTELGGAELEELELGKGKSAETESRKAESAESESGIGERKEAKLEEGESGRTCTGETESQAGLGEIASGQAKSSEVESVEPRSTELESSERAGRLIDSSNTVDSLGILDKANAPDKAKGREKVTKSEVLRLFI
jgi:hypothetical protein